MTVTDSEKGYTFSFIAKEQEDSSYILDCGDFGECYMEPDEPANVVLHNYNISRHGSCNGRVSGSNSYAEYF